MKFWGQQSFLKHTKYSEVFKNRKKIVTGLTDQDLDFFFLYKNESKNMANSERALKNKMRGEASQLVKSTGSN